MKIENSFIVSTPPAATWAVLTDVERIAPCVPGAALTDIADDGSYKGTVKVRLGPVSLSFDGSMQFVERDDDAFTARLAASGNEGRNRGNARADVRFSLTPEGEGTKVTVETDLELAGSIAQYGRSAGVIKSVAESLIGQFTQCLERDILVAQEAPPDAPAAAPPAPAAQPAPQAEAISGFALLVDMIRRALRRLFGR